MLRLAAFNTNRKIADENLPKAIILGLADDYELTQRLSAMYVGKNFSEELIPAVVKTYMDPMTSARVLFQLSGNLKGYDAQKLIAQFNKENQANPYWEGRQKPESVAFRRQRALELHGQVVKYVTEHRNGNEDVIGRGGALCLKNDEFIVDSSGDRIFVTDVASLEASYLMSGDGVIIKGKNKLEGGKERTITVHFVYYRK